MRQDSDIEGAAGTVKNGKLTDELLAFVGSTLTTKLATNIDQDGTKTGVAITSIRSADINNTQLRDDNNVLQSFPFSATVTITFSNDILADRSGKGICILRLHSTVYRTSAAISLAGAATADPTKDSARVTLTSWTTTPLLRLVLQKV